MTNTNETKKTITTRKVEFGTLQGETISGIKVSKGDRGVEDHILFSCESGATYKMFHYQDGCEDVYIADICGDPEDIIGQEVLVAEERIDLSNNDVDEESSYTYTFYTIRTNQATIDIRWNGHSNGCYSESVAFEKSVETP